MGRNHGRKARIYAQLVANTGQAEPIPFLNKWTLSSATDKVEVTSFDDDNKTYAAGLPDAQGTLSGFADDATDQLYAASRDGIPRKFYLYPSRDDMTKYWHGPAIFDRSSEGGTTEAQTVAINWSAAGNIIKV